MSRRSLTNKRKILPDSKFNSIILSKFINIIMLHGKKSIAESIVYLSLDNISKKHNKSHIEIFEEIINRVKPIVEVKSRRVGGSTYQIPVEVKHDRRNTLAMRWIIESSKKRSEKSIVKKLTNEFFDILENKGLSIKKRDEIHRIADSNRAFAHYRW